MFSLKQINRETYTNTKTLQIKNTKHTDLLFLKQHQCNFKKFKNKKLIYLRYLLTTYLEL